MHKLHRKPTETISINELSTWVNMLPPMIREIQKKSRSSHWGSLSCTALLCFGCHGAAVSSIPHASPRRFAVRLVLLLLPSPPHVSNTPGRLISTNVPSAGSKPTGFFLFLSLGSWGTGEEAKWEITFWLEVLSSQKKGSPFTNWINN